MSDQDLIERLRRYSYQSNDPTDPVAELIKDLHDAADRIAELEAEIEQLRKEWEGLKYKTSAQIASLSAAVNTMHKEAIEQEKDIERLRAAIRKALVLLAGDVSYPAAAEDALRSAIVEKDDAT